MGFLLDESPAIRALGPLFKLTEVHLWDDGWEASHFLEPVKFDGTDYINEKSDAARNNGLSSLTEDVELAEQLSGLGLPLSFHTNKEKRNGVIIGRKKATLKNNMMLPKVIDDDLLDSVKVSEENGSPSNALEISEMLDVSEIQNHGIPADVDVFNLSAESGDSVSSFACSCNISNERDSFDEVSNLGLDNNLGRCSSGLSNISVGGSEATMYKNEKVAASLGLKDGSSARSCLPNDAILCNWKELNREMESVYLETPLIVDHETKGKSNDFSIEMMQEADVAAPSKLLAKTHTDIIATHEKIHSGEWLTYWDDFYMRNYFYNVKTKETTWDPPMEMEHIPFVTADETTKKLVETAEIDDEQLDGGKLDKLQAICFVQPDLCLSKEYRDDDGLLSQQLDESAERWILTDCISSIRSIKKKKKTQENKI